MTTTYVLIGTGVFGLVLLVFSLLRDWPRSQRSYWEDESGPGGMLLAQGGGSQEVARRRLTSSGLLGVDIARSLTLFDVRGRDGLVAAPCPMLAFSVSDPFRELWYLMLFRDAAKATPGVAVVKGHTPDFVKDSAHEWVQEVPVQQMLQSTQRFEVRPVGDVANPDSARQRGEELCLAIAELPDITYLAVARSGVVLGIESRVKPLGPRLESAITLIEEFRTR